jgi:hypothetical protein
MQASKHHRRLTPKKQATAVFLQALVPALVTSGLLERVSLTGGHGNSYDVYRATPSAAPALKNAREPLMLPVPSVLREQEKKAEEKRQARLKEIEAGGVDLSSLPKEELESGEGPTVDANLMWSRLLKRHRDAGREEVRLGPRRRRRRRRAHSPLPPSPPLPCPPLPSLASPPLASPRLASPRHATPRHATPRHPPPFTPIPRHGRARAQEYIVNKLQKQLSTVLDEKRALESRLRENTEEILGTIHQHLQQWRRDNAATELPPPPPMPHVEAGVRGTPSDLESDGGEAAVQRTHLLVTHLTAQIDALGQQQETYHRDCTTHQARTHITPIRTPSYTSSG